LAVDVLHLDAPHDRPSKEEKYGALLSNQSGSSPDVLKGQSKKGPIWVTGSQMDCFSDPGTDFEEFDSEGVYLSRFKFRALEMLAHQQEQTVRKGVKQKPELVGKNPVAAEAIGFEFQLQFLDTILDITPKHIDLVIDPPRIEAQIGNHKSLIGALF